jgi:TolA-binding protein
MPLRAFSFWILILAVGFMQLFYTVQERFNERNGLKKEISNLKAQVRREEMKTQLASYQMRDFQQTVASMMPRASKGLGDYQKRTIASLVVEPDRDKVKIDFSSTLFEKGKTAYRENDYDTAASMFKNLIEKYPLSRHTIDAYFLLVESRYQAGEIDDCLETIDTMVTLFPEHDLTGFALIRLGQIFAGRDRLEDAEQVYRLALREFKNPDIREQADRLLKEISL